MVDYPSTKVETLAFAKYSHALNGVFEICEQARPRTADEDEGEGEGDEDEEDEDDEDAS